MTLQTIDDPRFKSLQNDPRFIRPSKKHHKPVIDSRFHKTTTPHDHTHPQRKAKKPKKQTKTLEFIDLARGKVLLESSDEEDDDQSGDEKASTDEQIRFNLSSDQDSSTSEDEEEDIELGPSSRSSKQKKRVQPDDGLDLLDEPDLIDEEAEEKDQIPATKRIAVVNLDWDQIKPIDLFKAFSSVLSTPDLGGASSSRKLTSSKHRAKGEVKKVSIYKSEFGKKRMMQEDINGPPKEIFQRKPVGLNPVDANHAADDDDDSDSDDLIEEDEGADLDQEALRRYQLDRLRYFYAVIELDSEDSAQRAYEEIHGTEFERTANIFDLSYIPQDMSFDEVDLHDECTEDTNDYEGVNFSTDALRHSKVKLTWDSEDPHRAKVTRLNPQKMTREELDKMRFEDFVAPPSSDEEIEENPNRDRLRKLLGLEQEASQQTNEETKELEISFTPAFSDKNLILETRNFEEGIKKNKNNKRKKIEDDQIDKPKVSDRAELELILEDDDDEIGRDHFDLNQIVKNEKNQKKKKPKHENRKKKKDHKTIDVKEDQFQIDIEDKRFSKVFEDFEFAIDPSNPQYKKTNNMDKLIETSRKKRKNKEDKEIVKKLKINDHDNNEEKVKLNRLIDSLKR